MYNKKLISLVYIILSFTNIYGKILSKEEVLNLEGRCISECDDVKYYCKDDICTEYGLFNKTIEFSDINGTTTSYIVPLLKLI
jgi:hypothetical protein